MGSGAAERCIESAARVVSVLVMCAVWLIGLLDECSCFGVTLDRAHCVCVVLLSVWLFVRYHTSFEVTRRLTDTSLFHVHCWLFDD